MHKATEDTRTNIQHGALKASHEISAMFEKFLPKTKQMSHVEKLQANQDKENNQLFQL